ncbi:MAG TPA: hypothetical protein VFD43_04215 [Planctomycetota bacterium]|nr:hypothetical protein [Planctomycetota bacterium]
MRSPWRRFAAWSCLVVVLLQGGVSSRGLVLCVEPDGAVNLEAAGSGLAGERCGECPSPASQEAGAGSRAADGADICPCVDITIVPCPDRMRPGGDPLRLLHGASCATLPTPFAWTAERQLSRGPSPKARSCGPESLPQLDGVGLRI